MRLRLKLESTTKSHENGRSFVWFRVISWTVCFAFLFAETRDNLVGMSFDVNFIEHLFDLALLVGEGRAALGQDHVGLRQSERAPA